MKVQIWSTACGAYWLPNGNGYTTKLDAAGVFDAEEALKLTRHCEHQLYICSETNVPLRRFELEKWQERYMRTRRELTPAPPRPDLEELLSRAAQHVMTPEEVFEQRVSWVYGNLALDGVQVTKDQVRLRALEMYGSPNTKYQGHRVMRNGERVLDPQLSGNWSA